MSTVSNNGDALTRLKDEYQKRETENEKLHHDEVQKLRESHRAEITKMAQENNERLDRVRQESTVKLNNKDIQHQKEIQTIREMHNRKLARAKGEET